MTTFDLIALGRCGVDLYPEQVGPLAKVETFHKSLGGSAANVAVAAARLGRSSALVSKVGADRFGGYVRDALADFGVDTRWIGTDRVHKTPVVFAELDPPETPGIEFYRWPKAPDLELEVVDLDMAAIRDARIVWVTGTGLSVQPSRDTTIAAMSARGDDQLTVLDLDYRPVLWSDRDAASDALALALPHATVVVGNREEVGVALGLDGDVVDATGAANALLAKGPRIAIVKLGGDGVLIAAREGGEVVTEVVEPIRVDVVCGLGAGDAFGGALAHGLLEEWSLAQVARFANAAGAYVAGKLECADAMPNIAQVEDLLGKATHA